MEDRNTIRWAFADDFDAVDMAKYLNYGLNYKNTFA